MKRDYRLFIRDILEGIENIEYFIGNMDFNEFYADDKTRSAVVWKIGGHRGSNKEYTEECKG